MSGRTTHIWAAVLPSVFESPIPPFSRPIQSGGSPGTGGHPGTDCLPAGSSPQGSGATCSPRGRGQACVTRKKTLPGWTPGGTRGAIPSACRSRNRRRSRSEARGVKRGCVPGPQPEPSRPRAGELHNRAGDEHGARNPGGVGGGRSSPTAAGDRRRSGRAAADSVRTRLDSRAFGFRRWRSHNPRKTDTHKTP